MRATRAIALISVFALLGALFLGCGQHGFTLPSPDGGPIIPPASSAASVGPSLAGLAVPCPMDIGDITVYEAPDVAGTTDVSAVAGTFVKRSIVSWLDGRSCSTGVSDGADVAVVIDRSGSMSTATTPGGPSRMDASKEAAKVMVGLMGPDDRAEIISFNSTVTVDQPFTSDKGLLIAAIDALSTGGSTAVWDAGQKGIDDLITDGRADAPAAVAKAVILLTDGVDNRSTATRDSLIAAAVAAGFPIYTIGLGTGVVTTDLEKVADDTGGLFLATSDVSTLTAAFLKIFTAISGGTATVVWDTAFKPGDMVWLKLVYLEGTAGEVVIGPTLVTITPPTP
ncbi:MAG TPA: VWA domain-containing protein [Armatimonadota bacterium]|nr:VWA domain-containing protein [Armatimonadota bacterium]